jgi:hypothetical protein
VIVIIIIIVIHLSYLDIRHNFEIEDVFQKIRRDREQLPNECAARELDRGLERRPVDSVASETHWRLSKSTQANTSVGNQSRYRKYRDRAG